MTQARSPLRQKSLRLPGQSLDDAFNTLWDDRGLFLFLYPVVLLMLLGVEWLRWLRPAPAAPWFTTIAIVLVTTFCWWRLYWLRKQLDALRQGRDGERAVAEILDNVRERGWRVFHDVVGDGFNIDHVVLSPHGIYAIETKTISKPRRGEGQPTIRVRSERITAGGADLGSAPVDQAKACADWLFRLLKVSTGKTYPVKPCVVFPGWFVEPMGKDAARGTWVLNPKALPIFIGNEPSRIQEADIHLAAFHLSSYIRSPWGADSTGLAKAILKRGDRHAHPAPATR